MKIILKDNSDLMLENLGEMINTYKQVEIAGILKCKPNAMDALRIQKPDRTVVEIRMPGLNGAEVLNEIKEMKNSVQCFVLTLYALDNYRHPVWRAVADFFFSKTEQLE